MKKKGLFFTALCFMMLILLTGCGNKTAITSETFKSKAEADGFTVTDAISQYQSYSYVTQALIAKNSNDWQVEFYVLSDENYAKSMFETNKNIFENISGNNKIKTESNIGNYSKFSVSTDSTYSYLCRIDNTMIYVNTSASNKDAAKDFVKKLGY